MVTMSNVSGGKQVVHRLRKRLKTEFGTVRPPRTCEQLQPMTEWPVCAEMMQMLYPLYMC